MTRLSEWEHIFPLFMECLPLCVLFFDGTVDRDGQVVTANMRNNFDRFDSSHYLDYTVWVASGMVEYYSVDFRHSKFIFFYEFIYLYYFISFLFSFFRRSYCEANKIRTK